MFYFRNLIFKIKEVEAQNIQTSHQGDLKKTRHIKQITCTHLLNKHKADSRKNKKKYLMRFDPDARVFALRK